MTAIPPTPSTLTLGSTVLQLRPLRMKHVRAGILDRMKLVTDATRGGNGAERLAPAQLEAMIDVVYASVDDQIARPEFDALLNALAPFAGLAAIADAIGPVLEVSGLAKEAPPAGEGAGPATASTSPGSTA